jgi:hypothetical protein
MRRYLLLTTFLLAAMALMLCLALPAIGQGEDQQADLIGSYVRDISVGQPTGVGSLVVFPLYSRASFPEGTKIQSVGEAMASEDIIIREMPGGMDQRFLMASNNSDGGVFGQYGGGYGGGGQGRGGGGGFYMAPLSSAKLPVVCYEEGRMGGDSPFFEPTSYHLAHPALRGLSVTGNQEAVWREIGRQHRLLAPLPVAIPIDEYTSPAYSSLRSTGGVVSAQQHLWRTSPTLAADANGVLVACGDRILGIDFYGDADLFTQCRQDVLDSYAMVNAEVGSHVRCTVTDQGIVKFLADLVGAPRTARESVQLGDTAGIAFGNHAGEALALEGHLIYLGAHDMRPPPGVR